VLDKRMPEGAEEIVEVCREFRQKEVEPVVLELDGHPDPSRVRAIYDGSSEVGIPSMLLSEEAGGAGQAGLTAALVLDEMAFSCAGIACVFAQHLAASLVLEGDGMAANEPVLRACSGEGRPALLTIAWPGDAEGGPRLERAGGEAFVNGTARLVACAQLADYLVVPARDDSSRGYVPLLIEAKADGLSIGETEAMLGLRAVPFADVSFSGTKSSGEQVGTAAALQRAYDAFMGFVAAISMGASRCASEKALQYAKDRYQFGKMLIEHQEIRRMLGNMAVKTNAGTAAYIQAFGGEPLGALATGGRCDYAKVFCTDAALEVVMDAIQIHGGIGYMKETGLEKIMRDAKMLQLLGAANRALEVSFEAEQGGTV
jgi:butyryl-CoA dehydrogenase